jgi:hypothetical protein
MVFDVYYRDSLEVYPIYRNPNMSSDHDTKEEAIDCAIDAYFQNYLKRTRTMATIESAIIP